MRKEARRSQGACRGPCSCPKCGDGRFWKWESLRGHGQATGLERVCPGCGWIDNPWESLRGHGQATGLERVCPGCGWIDNPVERP
eukprot:g70481.t1